MTAINRVSHTKAPITTREARKDKAAAAGVMSSHALGAFTEAVEELEIANELLTEAVEEDRVAEAELRKRIENSTTAIQTNAKVIGKIRDLIS